MAEQSARVQKAQEAVKAAQERLKKAKAAQQRAAARQRAAASKAERAKETRRKVLVGAFVLEKFRDIRRLSVNDAQFADWLTRADDRELFGLPPLVDKSPQAARAEARAQQAEREERNRLAHAPVAARLRDPKQARAVALKALEQVKLWRRDKLCSTDYIEAWEQLLIGPPEAVAALLEADTPEGLRMRQNTPFAAFLSAGART